MKRDLVYTTDKLPTRPFDATRFLAPSPHQNRRRRARVEKVGLDITRPRGGGAGAMEAADRVSRSNLPERSGNRPPVRIGRQRRAWGAPFTPAGYSKARRGLGLTSAPWGLSAPFVARRAASGEGGGTRNCFWQNNPMQSRIPRRCRWRARSRCRNNRRDGHAETYFAWGCFAKNNSTSLPPANPRLVAMRCSEHRLPG
jgi:hypothetical protein